MAATRLITAAGPARAAPARPAVRAARPSRRVRVMAKIGYARVSTRSQNDDSQVDDLTAYGCDKIFTDTASGKLAARPELDRALAYLREGDVLVITRLSRAMRSLKHLLALADELRQRGADLVVLKQQIDTTTPTGRLVFHVLGVIDEFQRELTPSRAPARGWRSPGRWPGTAGTQAMAAGALAIERDVAAEQIARPGGWRCTPPRSTGCRTRCCTWPPGPWAWSPAWPRSNPTRAPPAPTCSCTAPCGPPPACSSSWPSGITAPPSPPRRGQAAATAGLTSAAAGLGKAAEALYGLIEMAEMTGRSGRTGKTDLN